MHFHIILPSPSLPTWRCLSSSSVFCPKAGSSLQVEKPRLQFCRRQVFHRKLRNKGCSFTRDLVGAVASRCFSLSALASEQTLKDLKRSQGHQRGGEWIWLTGPYGLLPQGLNISSIRFFDQIIDPDIPFNLRPIYMYIYFWIIPNLLHVFPITLVPFLIILDEECKACKSALCSILHSPGILPLFLNTFFLNTLNLCSSLKVRLKFS